MYLAITPHREPASNVVRIYCASGLRSPIEQLVAEFNRRSETQFEIVRTGGSGELAGQIKTEHETNVARRADLYITADEYLLSRLHQQGIVVNPTPFARQSAVIAVPYSSDLRVSDLSELLSIPNLRIGVASEQAAIGRLTRQIAKREGQLERLEHQKTTDSENVMILAQALVAGSLEAAVVWDTTVSQINSTHEGSNPVIKTIAWAGASEDRQGKVAIGIVEGTEKSDACLAFCQYLTSSGNSQTTFENFGYSFDINP